MSTVTYAQRERLRCLVSAIEAVAEVGPMPSKAVQNSAMQVLVAENAERVPGAFHVYEVDGSDRTYDVALRGERRQEGYTITEHRCPCEAGQNNTVCKHVLTALALATEQGHRIDLTIRQTQED